LSFVVKYFSRMLYAASAVLLLLLAFLAMQDYTENPTRTENFVTLEIVTFEPIKVCDTDNCDTGGFTIPDTSVVQASGMIMRTENGKSYILTADHFCEAFSSEEMYFNPLSIRFESILNVYEVSGQKRPGRIVHRDRRFDICMIETDAYNVKDIKLAKKMPKHGESIYTISAPLGWSGPGYAIHLNGMFSGCSNMIDCFYSIPARPGSSGSVIVNKKGEAIGMIQRASPGVQFISMGSNHESLFIFMYEASESLGVNLLD